MADKSTLRMVSGMTDLNSSFSGKNVITDWSKCVICQVDSDESLKCPVSSNRVDLGSGAAYATFERDILGYDAINELPHSISVSRLNDGSGVCSTMIHNEAKWHRSCRLNYNSTKLQRLEKRKSCETADQTDSVNSSKRTRSTLDTSHVLSELRCFFCDETGDEETLFNASTFSIDSHLREWAEILCDEALLAKLSRGDVMALEAKYHKPCLTSLYNRVVSHKRRELKQDRETGTEKIIESIVFAELVSFVKENKTDELSPVMKLSELKKLYVERLEELGVSVSDVHSGRLRDRLCKNIVGLKSYKQGRECVLAFEDGIGQALVDLCRISNDDNAMCLARAADIIREQLFLTDDESTMIGGKNVVPHSLVMLLQMILEGSSIKDQLDVAKNNYAQSIAELIKFNSVKHKRAAGDAFSRHNRHQETPLPVFVGLSVYAQTRKKSLIDQLFHLGLSVSYDRVSGMVSGVSSSVCDYFNSVGVVCPQDMQPGIFTTAAIDNIDHNPSSNSINSTAFHGTGISLFQHHDQTGTELPSMPVFFPEAVSTEKASRLPRWYASVPPDSSRLKDQPPACRPATCALEKSVLHRGIEREMFWLHEYDSKRHLTASDKSISWTAYHSGNTNNSQLKSTCKSAMLPLFQEAAHSTAMMKHGLEVIKKAIMHVNPLQTPVVACDQPLYAIAKQIQWTYPEQFGCHQIFIMFGGLHIEMAALKTIGHWLDGSGWCDALVQAGITTQGVAESLLSASHVKRARYAH